MTEESGRAAVAARLLDLSSASSMEEERMADGQAEVQPLPDMDPELSAPPPPLPEATIPSWTF